MKDNTTTIEESIQAEIAASISRKEAAKAGFERITGGFQAFERSLLESAIRTTIGKRFVIVKHGRTHEIWVHKKQLIRNRK